MAKSTAPIAYQYSIDGAVAVIERVHVGTAYARNGNVGNPTEYFRWNWTVELLPRSIKSGAHGNGSSRADAYERARASVLGIPYRTGEYVHQCENVRPWTDVKAEMQANYVGRALATRTSSTSYA